MSGSAPAVRLLAVADSPERAQALAQALLQDGCSVDAARDCAQAWKLLTGAPPAGVVIDVDLGDGAAYELCEKIRAAPALEALPVLLFVEAGGKEKGFAARADVCLVRPVAPRELRLWVSSLLRRVRLADASAGVIRVGDFSLDPGTREAASADRVVRDLTPKEFALLYELVRRRPHVVSKASLMKLLTDGPIRDNTIEVHVRNLRRKLGPDAARIVTVLKSGYRFE